MPGRNLWKHLNVAGFSQRYLNCNLISIFLFIHSGDETEDWIVSWILLFFLWAGIDLTFLFFLFQDLESRKSRCRSFCLIFSSTVFILLLPGIGACRSWDCFLFFSFLFFCLDVQTGSPEPSVMDKSHDSCAAAFLFTRIQLFNVRGSIASKSFVQLLTGQFNWINLSFRFSLILI